MNRLIVAITLLLVGCAKPTGNQIQNIQEAVFRFQFEKNVSLQQQKAEVYFLALGDPHDDKNIEDPNVDFLKRFANLNKPVAAYSKASKDENAWVIEKESGKGGIIFYVHNITITGQYTAEAEGGYREHSRSASGVTYQLKYGWRGWSVVDARIGWIANNSSDSRNDTKSFVKLDADNRNAPLLALILQNFSRTSRGRQPAQ